MTSGGGPTVFARQHSPQPIADRHACERRRGCDCGHTAAWTINLASDTSDAEWLRGFNAFLQDDYPDIPTDDLRELSNVDEP